MYYLNAKHGEKEMTGSATQPKRMESLARFVTVDIAAGSGQSLAITDRKDLYAWGTGKLGELGICDKQYVNFKEATKVAFDGKVSQVSAGVFHSCAVTTSGKLIVWGGNRQCQLGYPAKLKEVHKPFLFGGMIESASLSQDEDGPRTIYDSNIGLVYERVECGSAMTVMQVSQSPYLLVCGYNQHKAWGLP